MQILTDGETKTAEKEKFGKKRLMVFPKPQLK